MTRPGRYPKSCGSGPSGWCSSTRTSTPRGGPRSPPWPGVLRGGARPPTQLGPSRPRRQAQGRDRPGQRRALRRLQRPQGLAAAAPRRHLGCPLHRRAADARAGPGGRPPRQAPQDHHAGCGRCPTRGSGGAKPLGDQAEPAVGGGPNVCGDLVSTCRSPTPNGWAKPARSPRSVPWRQLCNALAETVIGLCRTELIRRRGPWRASTKSSTPRWGGSG
jgi:hypothetical protein